MGDFGVGLPMGSPRRASHMAACRSALWDADGPVLGRDRGERLEVVNVERVVECRVDAAVLTSAAVAGQNCEAPSPVGRQVADRFRCRGFIPFEG